MYFSPGCANSSVRHASCDAQSMAGRGNSGREGSTREGRGGGGGVLLSLIYDKSRGRYSREFSPRRYHINDRTDHCFALGNRACSLDRLLLHCATPTRLLGQTTRQPRRHYTPYTHSSTLPIDCHHTRPRGDYPIGLRTTLTHTKKKTRFDRHGPPIAYTSRQTTIRSTRKKCYVSTPSTAHIHNAARPMYKTLLPQHT